MKKIIISIAVSIILISGLYASDVDIFDGFRLNYQGYINKHAGDIDKTVETYLESIQYHEGAYVELIRDIGERFSRGGLVKLEENSWFIEYNRVCEEGFAYATEKLGEQQGLEVSIYTSKSEHITLQTTCKTLMSNKLIAYKSAAGILAFEQLGKLIEYEHKVYFQKIQEKQGSLMSMIHRTIVKISETASNYSPVREVLQ